MFSKLIAVAFSAAVTLGFTQTAAAAEAAAEPATIIVYRAAESVKTKRVNLAIRGDSSQLGRLSADKVVVAQSPAGEYTLSTSIKGADALTMDLKPGATYYVLAEVAMRGSRISVELQEVPEQVARVQQPALESTI